MKPIQRLTLNQNDCETIHQLIPAYSVGATDADETRLVETHLKNCPDAAAELEAYQTMADKLLYSIPLRQAPDHLGDQLMAEIAQRTFEQKATPDVHVNGHKTFDSRFKGTVATRRSSYALAFVALVVMLLASNLYWFNQLAAMQQTQAQMNALLQGHTAILALMGAGKTQRIELQNVGETSGRAVLLCNPDEDVGFVYAEDFPALPSNDVYQVWLIREDQRRINAGMFQTDDEGAGTLIFQFSEPLRNFDSIEIMRETTPVGLQSSTALVMQGTLPY